MAKAETIPDVAVVAFLKSKGVDVEPPAPPSRLSSGINGVITGTAGPLAGAAGFALSAQEKNAKLQEWTSWKQWAIGHSEWPQFWETNRDELLKEGEKEAEAMETRIKKDKSDVELVGLIIFGMFTWGVGPAIYAWRKYGTRWPTFLLIALAVGMIGIAVISTGANRNSPSYTPRTDSPALPQ